MVRGKGEVAEQSWESHVHEEVVSIDLTVSVASVPSDMHPAELRKPVSVRCFESIPNTDEVEPIKIETAYGTSNLDDVWPMGVDTAVLRAGITDENAGKLVPVCKFNRKKYKSIEIFSGLCRIMKVPYPS